MTTNNITGVKISEFNVSQSIPDSALIPFVSLDTNLTIKYSDLKTALGISGSIKPEGGPNSVSILNQPSSSISYVRGIRGDRGVTALLAPTSEVLIRGNFANDNTGEGVVVDATANQVVFKSIVGGTNTTVSTIDNTLVIDVEDSSPLVTQKIVRTAADFDNPLDPTVQYFVDGVVEMGGTQINIGPNGGNINGLGFGVSGITSSATGYTMFNGASVGNVFISNVELTVSGASSQVFNLADSDGSHAFEINTVNFNNCVSLGVLSGFRQGLEKTTGRFGGTPTLQLAGAWDGYRVTTSIARNISNSTIIFSAGAGLTFSGRFITDINADLNVSGTLLDFAASNITNDESLIITGALISRNSVLDASDTTITPNITAESVKSNWSNNTGLQNTQKYIKSKCTTEVATALSGEAVGAFLPIAGTQTIVDNVQLDSPVNGQIRLLTGNGIYSIVGTIQVKGTAGDLITLKATLSTDGGSTFATDISEITLEIPNFLGSSDFATFSLSFIQSLKKDDRIRLEVANNTAARNVTKALESFFIISET